MCHDSHRFNSRPFTNIYTSSVDHVLFYNNMHTYTTISPYLFKDYSLLFNQTQIIASYLMLPVFSQISSIKRLVGCRVREL